MKITQDLIFDPEKNLAFDLYEPDNAPTKILIFWHGGGFFKGDKSNETEIGTAGAAAGFLTFIPNYRLAPRYLYPSANEDSDNFVTWLLNSKYYTDQNLEIVQIGASVGGLMALDLSMKYQFKTVSWSAPLNYSRWLDKHQDIKPSTDAKTEFGEMDPQKIKDSFYKYFTLTYLGDEDIAQKAQELDASHHLHDKIGEILMFNSTQELVPIHDVLELINLLAEKNLPAGLKTIAGEGHAMAYASDVLAESLTFLQK